MVVNRIQGYLKGIKDYGLCYKNNDKFELKVYIDVDWAGNVDDKKSKIWGVYFLGKWLISWTIKN